MPKSHIVNENIYVNFLDHITVPSDSSISKIGIDYPDNTNNLLILSLSVTDFTVDGTTYREISTEPMFSAFPIFALPNTGTESIEYIVEDDNGNSATGTMTVIVSDPPVTPDQSQCATNVEQNLAYTTNITVEHPGDGSTLYLSKILADNLVLDPLYFSTQDLRRASYSVDTIPLSGQATVGDLDDDSPLHQKVPQGWHAKNVDPIDVASGFQGSFDFQVSIHDKYGRTIIQITYNVSDDSCNANPFTPNSEPTVNAGDDKTILQKSNKDEFVIVTRDIEFALDALTDGFYVIYRNVEKLKTFFLRTTTLDESIIIEFNKFDIKL